MGIVRTAGRLARRVRRPEVSVIVELRGSEAAVRLAVDSVRDQAVATLEIVLVLVEEALRPLASTATEDRRARVVDAIGADPAAVRRAGAGAARAPRLLFLPPRQALAPGAVEALLSADGLVAGRVEGGPDDGEPPLLGRLLVPTALWDSTRDDAEPDGQTSAALLLAQSHTALPGIVLRDRGGERARLFERAENPLPGLPARIRYDEAMLETASAGARARWAAGILRRDLTPYLLAVEHCDDTSWDLLHPHTARLVEVAGEHLRDVPVEDRVLAWLVARGRREDAIGYAASRRFEAGHFETAVHDGVIRAELGADVPDDVLALTASESPLRARPVRAVVEGDEVVVELWAAIARLDEEAPEVTVRVGEQRVVAVLSVDPAITRWMGEPHQCHDHGVVTLRLPRDDRRLEVELTMADRGVVRATRLVVDPLDLPPEPGRKHPDLTDEEAGPYRQRRLQREYAACTAPLDPRLVYFQSFLGQTPTDHPAAICEALSRVRPAGVRILWGVADSTIPVPDGTEAVLLRSRAWYDALARAAYVVTNIELDPWFSRREGQQVLETYHGYPSKAMGLSQWRARGLPPTHLQQLLRRTSGAWNTLLTPIPQMNRYYRENYAFDGRIIDVGYPRDDALVAPDRDARRARARERLGIGDRTAILYAPTWRDDLATDFRRARAVLHLDVEQAARELGPGHVVLLRGHRFHTGSQARAGRGAQVLDVTAYPEVNDLILAADAAVLDYSSLRFDFALTGRPMVFLVPDLAAYTQDTRGFLYPFEDSAPGPFARTTGEVVAALRDVGGLRQGWEARIEAFNAAYQPLADGHASERVVAEFFAPLLEGR